MCVSIQQKKKKIHEISDHPFGTDNLLVLQMWYRLERKLALGIPFCTRPEPTAVRAAPTTAYVIHLYLQMRRLPLGGWALKPCTRDERKMQGSRATKIPSFRGSSRIYSPTDPSSRIRVPKHCLSAKAFDA